MIQMQSITASFPRGGAVDEHEQRVVLCDHMQPTIPARPH